LNINELGQLFITGISGLSLTEEEKSFIGDNNIGGIILFSHNYENPGQLAELVNEIQTLRDEYPLFISVDQEGGRVKRFKKHFTQLPSMFDIAKHDSPKLTFEAHKILAEELNACGVNVNYSPCCDIWTNPKNNVIGDRSFGKTKEIVEKHVSAAIRGLHTGNVLACAKHFPGHGDTLKDSHFDLPYVIKTKEELIENELVPFVKASKSRVEFMMMAHLVVDGIDKDLPTSLSPKAYDFLREHLKFNKIIITDDMEMKAVSERYENGGEAVQALKAGADIVLYRTMEKTIQAFKAVKEAVKKQALKKDNLDLKIRRVLSCKKTNFAGYQPIYIPSLEKLIPAKKDAELLDLLGLEE
jgi:beta-N-acetylhexosaminidase